MKKVIAIVCLLILLLTACSNIQYEEDDFIGKTSTQIIEEFGAFDCVGKDAGFDGLYRNTQCGYTVEAPKTGFFGRTEEVLLFILFDENGVAVKCRKGYRPGG